MMMVTMEEQEEGRGTHTQRVPDCFFGAIVNDKSASASAFRIGFWGEQLGDLAGDFDGRTRDFDASADGEGCEARRGVSEERRGRSGRRGEYLGPSRGEGLERWRWGRGGSGGEDGGGWRAGVTDAWVIGGCDENFVPPLRRFLSRVAWRQGEGRSKFERWRWCWEREIDRPR